MKKVFEEYGIHPKNFYYTRMFDGDKSDGMQAQMVSV